MWCLVYLSTPFLASSDLAPLDLQSLLQQSATVRLLEPHPAQVLESEFSVIASDQLQLWESVSDVMTSDQWQRVSENREKRQGGMMMVDTHHDAGASKCLAQLGEPRSASTLQFTAVCLAKLLQHPDEDVQCIYNPKVDMLKACKGGGHLVAKEHWPNVSKYEEALGNRTGDFEVVMSFRHGDKAESIRFKAEAEHLADRWGMPVLHTQTLDDLDEKGMSVIDEYKSVFSLEDTDMEYLGKVIGNWSILRQCCGAQMSKDWRNELQGKKGRHWDVASKAKPPCHDHDLDEIQAELLTEPIWWDLVKATDAGQRLVALFTTIAKDGTVSYLNCTRSNQYVADTNAVFNSIFPEDMYDINEDAHGEA